MSVQKIQGTNIARGTALVAIDRVYSPDHSHQPRTEHWMLSVTYYLNPKQVSDQAKIFPQFETINPLGLTITEFNENGVSVDPMTPGTAARFRLEACGELRADTSVLSRRTACAPARSVDLGLDDQWHERRIRGPRWQHREDRLTTPYNNECLQAAIERVARILGQDLTSQNPVLNTRL